MAKHSWKISTLVAALFLGNVAQAKYQYTFKDLALYDYSKMEDLVNKTSGRDVLDNDEREPKVRQALTYVLSRKNSDVKRTALFLNLQGQLPELFFQMAVYKIADEAIKTLQSNEPEVQKATALVVLENAVAEIQPRASDFKGALERIKTADISISDKLEEYRRREGMDKRESPSKLASRALENMNGIEVEEDFYNSGIQGKAVAKSSPELED